MNSIFTAIKPALAARLPSNRPNAPVQRQQQLSYTPLRAFSTYSGPPAQQQQATTPADALQALLHSELATSVLVMAEGAAAQSMEQVKRLSAAAMSASASARSSHVVEDNDAPATPPLGMPLRLRSALEQASFQTNESRYPPSP